MSEPVIWEGQGSFANLASLDHVHTLDGLCLKDRYGTCTTIKSPLSITLALREARMDKPSTIGDIRPKLEPIYAKLYGTTPMDGAVRQYHARQRRAQLAERVRASKSRLNARTEIGVGYWNNEHSNEL